MRGARGTVPSHNTAGRRKRRRRRRRRGAGHCFAKGGRGSFSTFFGPVNFFATFSHRKIFGKQSVNMPLWGGGRAGTTTKQWSEEESGGTRPRGSLGASVPLRRPTTQPGSDQPPKRGANSLCSWLGDYTMLEKNGAACVCDKREEGSGMKYLCEIKTADQRINWDR